MSDNLAEFNDDPRTPCKYGKSCYQKNEAHRKKYKHPPKPTNTSVAKDDEQTTGTSSKDKNEDKPKKKNLLTNWLKTPAPSSSVTPPNKKPKIENQNETKTPTNKLTNFSKDKTSKNEKTSAEDNEDLNNQKNMMIQNEDEDDNKYEDTEEKNQSKEVENKSDIASISILPLQMDVKTKIKTYFLVDMPDDFYKFWSFCESVGSLSLSKGDPLDALKNVGLKLVGPFDVLANKFSDNIVYNPSALLRHYRYFYDPPEFQTVIKSDDSSEFHLGYFRDDPKQNPVFVASNCAADSCIIKSVAENLFGAVNVYLDDYKKKADPFAKLKIIKLQNSLTTYAKKEGITLSTSTAAMKKRESSSLTKTFHKAGLVVPVDRKSDTGYRELAESDAVIKRILTDLVKSKTKEEREIHFSKLYPIITYANIANDECDFGTSLELGLDLFSFGSPLLHETIKSLLVTSYTLLKRNEFAKIIEAHLEDRKKGSNLSILKK